MGKPTLDQNKSENPSKFLEYVQWAIDYNVQPYKILFSQRKATLRFRHPENQAELDEIWPNGKKDWIGVFTLYDENDNIVQENVRWIQYKDQNGNLYLTTCRTVTVGGPFVGFSAIPYPPPYTGDKKHMIVDDQIHAIVDWQNPQNTWSVWFDMNGMFYFGSPV